MEKAISFWNYLKGNKIIVPIIQRDYAQGRKGKENLRRKFLTNIKEALEAPEPSHDVDSSENLPTQLKLDFVYGSKEKDSDLLFPLDGQQRLTTLWLLHWFIAWKAGKLDKETRETLAKFSYHTRRSSSDFCEALALKETPESDFELLDFVASLTQKKLEEYDLKEDADAPEDLIIKELKKANEKSFPFQKDEILRRYFASSIIRKQTWFFSDWEYDPTIQAMLRMIGGTFVLDSEGKDITDGLEEIFLGCTQTDFQNFWNKLTDPVNPPLIFYQLPMHDFGLSDDLYIKMNARGKQLTDFENFKADLIGFITDKTETDPNPSEEKKLEIKPWQELLDSKKGLPIKFDTAWTDIFWDYNDKAPGRVDDIFFAFINRFFLNYHLADIKDENDPYYSFLTNKGREAGDTALTYDGLDNYKWNPGEKKPEDVDIELDLLTSLRDTLNRFKNSKIKNEDLRVGFEKSFSFIPEYLPSKNGQVSVSSISQVQRVVFHALWRYLKDGEVEPSTYKESLRRWMRFVWNIVSVRSDDGRDNIRSVAAMKAALEVLNLIKNSHKVYEELKEMDFPEVKKKISGDLLAAQLEEEIEKAKKILDEENNLRKYDGEDEEFSTWEEALREAESTAFFKGSVRFLFRDKDKINWEHFNEKFKFVKKHFCTNEIDLLLMRNLISTIEDYDLLHLINLEGGETSWLNILLSKQFQPFIHDFLLSEPKTEEQLKAISISPEEKTPLVKARHDLFASNLLKELQTNLRDNLGEKKYILETGNPYRVVPPGKWAWYKICHIGNVRNLLLTDAIREDKIRLTDANVKLGASNFYKGDNINFVYSTVVNERKRDFIFQFFTKRNNKEHEQFDIYLMKKNQEGNIVYRTRKHKLDQNKGTDLYEYFCANLPSGEISLSEFYLLLESLIREHIEDSNPKNIDNLVHHDLTGTDQIDSLEKIAE